MSLRETACGGQEAERPIADGAIFHCFSLFFHRFSLFFAVFFAVFSLYFIDTDDWRMKAASNPLLTDKTVVRHFLPHSVPFWIRIGANVISARTWHRC